MTRPRLPRSLLVTILLFSCAGAFLQKAIAQEVSQDLIPGQRGGRSRPATLKVLAAVHDLRIGAVYQDTPDPRYKAVFAREYDVMTLYAGWETLHYRSRTSFDFAETDRAVAFAEKNGFEIQGQSLVWYHLIPRWVEGVPRSEIEAVMNEHIDRVVKRYAGRVKAWNVVNEATDDEGSDLRRGFAWSDAMGDDYIAKAFIRAHRADPNAILYYNETGMEDSDETSTARFRRVKRLLRDLLDQDVPVHALGWQMHVTPDFDSGSLLARMTEIAEMGLDNYITEFDVKLPEEPTPEDFERQKAIYRDIVRIFLKVPRRKTLVVWGLRDGLDQDWLPKNHPLPFDEEYRPKPAYFGIADALSGKSTQVLPRTSASGGAGSLSLNGTRAYAEVPHTDKLNPAGSWTVELWFRDEHPAGFDHPRARLLTKGDPMSVASVPYWIAIENNALLAGLRSATAGAQFLRYDLAANGVAPGDWHHVAATLEASTRELLVYLDGALVTRGTLDALSAGNTEPITVGCTGRSGQHWRGKIGDVRIWNVVRTAEEIAAGYAGKTASPSSGLVGRWRFNDGTGNKAMDAASAPQKATLFGGAQWSNDVPSRSQ